MPLVGLVDPSHYERAHDRPGRLPVWMTLEEILAASAAPNPKWSPWTFEMVQAALGEHQERGDRISTTLLTAACPRSSILERKVDYVGTLDAMYAALRGTMVHRTLEKYGRLGAIAEGRFYTTIDGITISGSPDLVTEETVYDYKVPSEQTGVPAYDYPFRSQTEQLMMNAYILRHAERWDYDGALPFDPRENPATHVAIVYIGPKSPKILEFVRPETFITPAGKEVTKKRPYVWNDDEVLNGYYKDEKTPAGFRPRLHLMQRALESYPDWPEPWEDVDTGRVWTAEEVWGGGPTWACPGPPLCKLECLAKRSPEMYAWSSGERA